YTRRLRRLRARADGKPDGRHETAFLPSRRLQKERLDAERSTLIERRDPGGINDQVLHEIERDLDLGGGGWGRGPEGGGAAGEGGGEEGVWSGTRSAAASDPAITKVRAQVLSLCREHGVPVGIDSISGDAHRAGVAGGRRGHPGHRPDEHAYKAESDFVMPEPV